VSVRLSTSSPPASSDTGEPPAIDTHRTAVWRYLRMLGASADDADELCQETLLAGLAAGLPNDPAHARAFLRGIARNQWLRTRRWWHRRREREVAAAVEELWVATAAPDDGEHLLTQLRDCLDGLQPRARQALELHYRDGLPWPQVATIIDLKPNGTKTLVQRARAALRQCLERSEP
jgi:RNA polymerase sigma-70 factor, ECF subfamily